MTTTTPDRQAGQMSRLFWLQMEGAFKLLNLHLAAFWHYTSGALALARGMAQGQGREALSEAAGELAGATLELGRGYARLIGEQGAATVEVLSGRDHAAPTWSAPGTKDARANGSFEVFEDRDGTSRFKLVGPDGKPILTSHSYADERSARRGVMTLRKNAMLDERYERKVDVRGDPFFELKAGNNHVLWTSEPYRDAASLEREIACLVQAAIDARVAG